MEAPENDRKRPPDGFLGRRREADVTPDTVLPRAQQDVALRTKDGARVRVLATVFGPALPPCWSDECVASWVPSSSLSFWELPGSPRTPLSSRRLSFSGKCIRTDVETDEPYALSSARARTLIRLLVQASLLSPPLAGRYLPVH